MRMHARPAVTLAAALAFLTLSMPVISGQDNWDTPCTDQANRDDRRYRECEARDSRLTPEGTLAIDATPNGGIRVEGRDGTDVEVRAVVRTRARSAERAKALLAEVRVETDGGRVHAVGPDTERGESWWVSYLVRAPRRTDLALESRNGSIAVARVSGTINVDTTNGSLRLQEIGGLVRGRTRNGSVSVALTGSTWEGQGLDIETTNGGVRLSVPDGYSARLETGTVNGRVRTDIPITVQGNITSRRGLSTTLGSGGATLSIHTTNGGVRITKASERF